MDRLDRWMHDYSNRHSDARETNRHSEARGEARPEFSTSRRVSVLRGCCRSTGRPDGALQRAEGSTGPSTCPGGQESGKDRLVSTSGVEVRRTTPEDMLEHKKSSSFTLKNTYLSQ